MSGTTTPFPHRQNADGSYDSICPNCCLTIASARVEGDLKALEQAHVCHGDSFLADRGMFYMKAS